MRIPRRARDPDGDGAFDLRAERRRAEGELSVRGEAAAAVRPAVRPEARADRRHRHGRGRQDQAWRVRRRQGGPRAGGPAGRPAAHGRRRAEGGRGDGQGERRRGGKERRAGGGDGGEGRRVIAYSACGFDISGKRLGTQMLGGHHGELCGSEWGFHDGEWLLRAIRLSSMRKG